MQGAMTHLFAGVPVSDLDAGIDWYDAIVRAVPTTVVRSRAAYLHDVRAQGQEAARAQWVIVALMIVISVMAAFNTGVMAAAERRRELVLARHCGATRAQGVIVALTLDRFSPRSPASVPEPPSCSYRSPGRGTIPPAVRSSSRGIRPASSSPAASRSA
jgi:hypothetical protein